MLPSLLSTVNPTGVHVTAFDVSRSDLQPLFFLSSGQVVANLGLLLSAAMGHRGLSLFLFTSGVAPRVHVSSYRTGLLLIRGRGCYFNVTNSTGLGRGRH